MTERDFCYWLKGFFELRDYNMPFTVQQTKMIEDHLNLVFAKVTPDRSLSHHNWNLDPAGNLPLAENLPMSC